MPCRRGRTSSRWRTTGATVDTFGRPYVAYNFDAITNSLSLGVSQALTPSLSLNARYEWHYTTRSHLSYTNNVLRLSIHAAF